MSDLNSELRNPKSERSPKPEIRGVEPRSVLQFSDFEFVSDFVFRISGFLP